MLKQSISCLSLLSILGLTVQSAAFAEAAADSSKSAQGAPTAAPPRPSQSTAPMVSSDMDDPLAIYQHSGASQEQLDQIRGLADEFEAGAKVKAERLKALLKQLHALSLNPDLDEKQILATQEQINGMQAEMAISRIRLLLRIRTVLSPEQRTRLVALMKERGQPRAVSK